MIQDIYELRGSSLRRQLRRAQAVVFYLDIATGDFILDVGCGEGFIANHLLRGSFVVGLDDSKGSLLIAKQKLKQSNLDFILADVAALPLKMNSFDKVTLLEVLEHLTEDKQRILCNEINKVLKDSGTLLISVPYKERISYTYCTHCGKQTPFWGHLCSFDEEKISNLLSNQYCLIVASHLPNVPLVSLSDIFQRLPVRIWLILNNLLGRIHQGYWLILKYKKNKSVEDL